MTPPAAPPFSIRRGSIPKALVVVVAGCRSDAMLVSDAPTLGGFVRGSGCFSFHMRHTWNGCGSAPSDAVLPLLTGARGSALATGVSAEEETSGGAFQEKKDGPVDATSVFARLAEVRSWVRVGAAIGGARDLAKAVAAEGAARVRTAPDASDAEAAATAERALRDMENGEDVVYLHLSGVQDAGAVHGYGPHVTAYRAAVEAADARVAAVIGALRARRAARPSEDWLVVVSSPAGGTTRADMPVTMQGHFDAADWNGGGGRQLRAAGVTGFDSLPQHATGWVLVDVSVVGTNLCGSSSDQASVVVNPTFNINPSSFPDTLVCTPIDIAFEANGVPGAEVWIWSNALTEDPDNPSSASLVLDDLEEITVFDLSVQAGLLGSLCSNPTTWQVTVIPGPSGELEANVDQYCGEQMQPGVEFSAENGTYEWFWSGGDLPETFPEFWSINEYGITQLDLVVTTDHPVATCASTLSMDIELQAQPVAQFELVSDSAVCAPCLLYTSPSPRDRG